VPGRWARPNGARMPLAKTAGAPPPAASDTIDADHGEAGVQWSHGAGTPTRRRPSGATARLFSSPTPAGHSTTASSRPKRVPVRSP
jgi:hypothetical protein